MNTTQSSFPAQSLLSIVVPIHNEADALPLFHPALLAILEGLGLEWELLYVDDGSTDEGNQLIAHYRAGDDRVGLLELSRNFGKEVALSAGLDHCRGDAVILMDADLQDPPAVIPEFIAQWQAGYDVVYGVRSSREGEPWLKVKTADWFYRTMNRLSDVEIPRDAGDFRLLSRRAIDALRQLPERHRYMKGLYAWIGFPQTAVYYRREPRQAGNSKWNYWRLWNFAIEGITSFSDVPLKISTYLGLLTSGCALLYGIYFLLRTLVMGNPIPGYPSLVLIILFLGGVQLICLGIIGEYLARTYNESKSRQLYFVRGYHPTAPARQHNTDAN